MQEYMPASDAVEVQLSREELLYAIRFDCATALAFYLGEELTLEVPDFHEELWDELLDLLNQSNSEVRVLKVLKKLLAVPREHAKTTLIKIMMLLFLRYSTLSFLAYVSKTHGSALNAIKDIRDWFLSPQDTNLYGPSRLVKSNETEGIMEMEIALPHTDKLKYVIMRSFGQQNHMRGILVRNRRPDLMVFDDIEDRDTLEPKVQAKLDGWALGTAMKALAKRGVVIFIGNMLADTSLLARLSKTESWNPTVFGAIVKDESGQLRPLWQGRWTLEALLQDYAEYRALGLGHIWEAEMMNLQGSDIFGVSLADAIKIPHPSPEDVTGGFICLDPAFGQESIHDDSAITVHVQLLGADIPFVVESRVGKMTEMEIFDTFLELSYYWGLTTWVIEAQAAQRLFIPLLKTMLIIRGIPAELFMILPVMTGNKAKASRIVAARNVAKARAYGFSESQMELIEKLERYDPTSKSADDHCDSFAHGTTIWATYGDLVKAKGKQNVIGAVMQGYRGSVGNVRESDHCPV